MAERIEEALKRNDDYALMMNKNINLKVDTVELEGLRKYLELSKEELNHQLFQQEGKIGSVAERINNNGRAVLKMKAEMR